MNEDRVLDWRSGHDPRSKNFTFYGLAPGEKLTEPKFWKPGMILDQGREGACVGFGWTAELIASPYSYQEKIKGETQKFAQQLYQMARVYDKEQGYNWPEGASVLGGAKSCRMLGYIEQYRWAMSVEEIRDALRVGPVVIGIPWYEGMYQTRKSGLVEIKGKMVGGHCLTITGYHPGMRINGEGWKARHEVFRWVNSWGNSYGVNGTGLIRMEDLAYLMKQNGEACIPLTRKAIKRLL